MRLDNLPQVIMRNMTTYNCGTAGAGALSNIGNVPTGISASALGIVHAVPVGGGRPQCFTADTDPDMGDLGLPWPPRKGAMMTCPRCMEATGHG